MPTADPEPADVPRYHTIGVSAIVLNSMFGRRVYEIRDAELSTVW